PRLIATDPEIAAVGLTEVEARTRYKDKFEVTRYGFAGLDRARTRGRGEGHIKIINGSGGRIVGAGLAGDVAGEIAAILALAIAQRLRPLDLVDLVAPYPALGEIVPLIAAQYGQTHRRTASWRAYSALKRLLP